MHRDRGGHGHGTSGEFRPAALPGRAGGGTGSEAGGGTGTQAVGGEM